MKLEPPRSLFLAVCLAGCGTEAVAPTTAPLPEVEAPPTTAARPAESARPPPAAAPTPRGLRINPASSGVALTIGRTLPPLAEVEHSLAAIAGDVVFDATRYGIPVPAALTIEVADVELDAETLPPRGLHLTRLSVSLEHLELIEGQWNATGDRAHFEARATLTLDWSLDTGGASPTRLRPVPLRDVRIGGDVLVGPDGPEAAAVYGVLDGVFWQWGRMIEFADLGLSVQTEGREP